MIGKELAMITVYEDFNLGFRIKWNQDCAFQVWQEDQEVDYFSFMEPAPLTLSMAIDKAKGYCEMVHYEMMEN